MLRLVAGQLAALDDQGTVRCLEQKTAGGPWSAWQRLPGSFTEVWTCRRRAGLEIYAIDTDGAAQVTRRQASGFTPWTALGGPAFTTINAVEAADGRALVLALDTDGTLHQRWYP